MKSKLSGNKALLLITGALAFLLGLFGPIEFYFSNIYNVWYDLYNILPTTIVAFVVIWVILVTIGLLMKKESIARKIYEYTIMILNVCLYIQGTFIKIPYGEMNGESIEWDKYAADDMKSTLIWCLIIVVAVFVCRKIKYDKLSSVFSTISVCLIIVQIISIAIVGVSSEGFIRKEALRPLNEKAYTYSKEQNLNILILDTYDARVFEDYILNGNTQAVSEQFEDFTYCRDTMGVYTLTNYAVPQILTGEKFMGDIYYGEYIEKAYAQSPFLKQLKDNAWNVRIHTDQVLPEKEGAQFIDNAGRVRYEANDLNGMMAGVYKLVAFKYAPTALKKYVYYPYEYLEGYKCEEYVNDIPADKCEFKEDSWDNLDFYKNIVSMEMQDDEKTCQIYHLKGLHALRNLDDRMEYIYDSNSMYSLEQEAGVVNDIIAQWIEMLKKIGSYDNSAIVIMADHGSVEYQTDDDNFAQCPLFMMKGVGEKHDFTISQAPLSYEDLQGIFCGLAEKNSSTEVIKKSIGDDITYETYGINELQKHVNSNEYEKVGRVRTMIFHRFSGNLGGKSKGDSGYELYTEYPSYIGTAIQIKE